MYQRSRALKELSSLLTCEHHRRLSRIQSYNWLHQARPQQRLPEGKWRIWLIMAGRGFGKTRTGAETIRQWVTQGVYQRICLLGTTLDEARHVMVEGHSGLMAISPPHENLIYHPARRLITWRQGAIAQIFSATSCEHLRGPQFDAAWIDELAKFPKIEETWDQLMLGLRLGTFPRVIITTTPKPLNFLHTLIQRNDVVVTRGSTFDNAANLAPDYLANLKERYSLSALGDQEIQGHLLTDTAGSLWSREILTACLSSTPSLPPFQRCVVAVDPAVTFSSTSDETGIIVAGLDYHGCVHIIDDLSGHYDTCTWAQIVIEAYHHYRADDVIAEVNNGGDLVENLLRCREISLSYQSVRARGSKTQRAEPVAHLYALGKVRHCRSFPELENQLCLQSHQKSPDRLDALVWAIHALKFSEASVAPPSVWST